MTVERATRLAKGRQRNGFRGWRARRAWRRLVDAGDHGHHAAIGAVWSLWEQDQAADVLECMARWWSRPTVRNTVLAHAVDPAVRAESRATLGSFCARNGLVPQEPVDRVRFFALTGQPDQHRALDPDGALLTIAYRTADQATRTALREAMTGTGDLDVVKVIAASGEPTSDEVAYLTRHLAATRQWPALWRFVRDLPLRDAVAAADLFTDWAPRDPGERHAFDRLASAVADTVAAATETLDSYRTAAIWPSGTTVSFAHDSSELAVVPVDGIDRYTLPAMVYLGKAALIPRRTKRVLHLGESLIALEGVGLVQYTSGRGNTLWTNTHWHDQLWALTGTHDRFFAARSGELLVGTETTLRHIPRYELGIPAVFAFPLTLATEHASGRLAIAGSRELDLSILDEKLRVLAHRQDENGSGFRDVIFAGPDRLITVDTQGWVIRWRRTGNTLRLEHSVRTGKTPKDAAATVTSVDNARPSLCALPALGRLAVIGDNDVTWLDTDTFATVDPPPGLGADVKQVWSSVDGHHLAVTYRTGKAELRNLLLDDVADLMATPLSSMIPAALTTVKAAQRGYLSQDVTKTLDLLHTLLAHQFDTDISLGTATTVRAADDIALGGVG